MKRGDLEPPADLRPAVVVHLKPGWSYDAEEGRFESDEGIEIAALTDLPAGTEIVATVPELAAKPAARRDPDEDRLARSFQVILAKGVAPDDVRSMVEGWECVESAQEAPIVSLPAEQGPIAAGPELPQVAAGTSEEE